MSVIFISHSTKDAAAASEIAERLEAAGHHSIFLDFDPDKGIPPGQDWERELYRQLRACRAVVVLWSQSWTLSRWCFAEFTHARSLGKHIFPITIDDNPERGLLSDLQFIDGTQGNWGAILKHLERGFLAAGLDPRDAFDWDGSRPPYPGLKVFDERDAAVFFGRDTEIDDGLDALNRLRRFGGPRLLLVLGASGCGKSSLVRAGLVPRLRRDWESWLVCGPLQPSEQPLTELGAELELCFARYGKCPPRQHFKERIRSGAFALLTEELRAMAGRPDLTLLLVIDQLEELFSHEQSGEVDVFLSALGGLLGDLQGSTMVLASLRSDFLATFQALPSLRQVAVESLPLGPMGLNGLAKVITEPARVAGLDLETGLVQTLIDDTGTDDALPLLAFTLRELWERCKRDTRLTVDAYRERLGGISRSLACVAEATLRGDPAWGTERWAVRELELHSAFLQMVRMEEAGYYARRRADFEQIPLGVRPLLERFVKVRLLVSGADDEGCYLEVAHEAIFRVWNRLAGWLEENREYLLWRKRFAAALDEWERIKRHPSALLRGVALAEAEKWLTERERDASEVEFDFLARSQGWATQQRRRITVVLSVVLGVVMAVAIFAVVQARNVAEQARIANEQRQIASVRRLGLEARLVVQQNPTELPLSVLLAIEAMRTYPSRDAYEVLYNGATLLPRRVSTLVHGGTVTGFAFSGDGSLLGTASDEGILRVWQVPSGRLVARFRHEDAVRMLLFNDDASRLATASQQGVQIIETATGRRISRMEQPMEVSLSGFSHDGRFLVTKTRLWTVAGGTALRHLSEETPEISIAVWEVSTGREIKRIHQATYLRGEMAAVLLSDGKLLAASGDAIVQTWDLTSGRKGKKVELRRKLGAKEGVSADDAYSLFLYPWKLARDRGEVDLLVFSPSGEYLAAAWSEPTYFMDDADGGPGNAWVRKLPEGTEIARMKHGTGIQRVAFSPDSRYFASASREGIQLCETATGTAVGRPLTGNRFVGMLAFSADSRYLAANSGQDMIRVWQIGTGREVARISAPAGFRGLRLSPTDALLAAGVGAREIRLWRLERLEVALENRDAGLLQFFDDWIELDEIAFSERGGYLAATGTSGGHVVFHSRRARLWDIATGREYPAIEAEGSVVAIAFSEDGRRLATGGGEWVQVWSLPGGEELARLRAPNGASIGAVALSPDGQHMAAGGTDAAWLWDVSKLTLVQELSRGHRVDTVLFSPDARRLATGSRAGGSCLWEVSSGNELACFPALDAHQMAFSPDGALLAGRDHGTLQIWDMSGRFVLKLSYAGYYRGAIAFGPDGKYVAAFSTTAVHLWEVATGREIGLVQYPNSYRAVAVDHRQATYAWMRRDAVTADDVAGTSLIWPNDLASEICDRLDHDLTRQQWARFVGDSPYRRVCDVFK